MQDKLQVYTAHAGCAPCGGKCCKHAPGASSPEDWGPPGAPDFDAIRQALLGGRWLIDWWEGDPRPGYYEIWRAYFLRPAVRGFERGVFAEESEGTVYLPLGTIGPCTFHSEDRGCTSPRKPYECATLEPRPDLPGCRPPSLPGGYNMVKQIAAVQWLPYRERLCAIGRDLLDEDEDEDEDV